MDHLSGFKKNSKIFYFLFIFVFFSFSLAESRLLFSKSNALPLAPSDGGRDNGEFQITEMGVLLWKGSAFMSSGDDGGDDDSNELLTPPVMQLDGDKVLFGGLSPVKKENRYENVRVLDVVNIPFSLTLDGFLSFGDDDYVLFIRDNHSKEVHRVTVGEVIPGTQFRVVEVFKVPCENSNNGAGMATEKAYAVIDNELMPPITLRLGEDIYVDIHSVSVECDFKGQKATYVLHEVGQCFTFNSHQYQLTEVMFRDRLLVFTCSDESTGEQSIIPFHY